MILIYVPCRDKDEAVEIGKELMSRKVVACVNIFPITSMFFWEGELKSEDETVLLVKTVEEKEKEARELIVSLHSYDVPAVVTIPAREEKRFGSWMRKEIGC